jgi:vancomycin resistance protein YoaR
MIRFVPGQHPLPYFKPFQFWLLVLVISFTAASAVAGALYLHQYRNLFYPGIVIDSIPVGGLSASEARTRLMADEQMPVFTITVAVDDIRISSSSSELQIDKKIDQSIQNGILYAKTGWWPKRLWTIIKLQFEPQTYTSPIVFDRSKTQVMLNELAQRVNTDSQEPSAILKTSNLASTLEVQPGQFGREVVMERALDQIMPPRDFVDTTWEVPVASTGGQLTTSEVEAAKTRATKLVGSVIEVKAPDKTFTLNDQAIINLLAFPTDFSLKKIQTQLAQWAEFINRPAQDAVFEYNPQTLTVTKFAPHRDGLALVENQTQELLLQALQRLEADALATSAAMVEQTPAEIEVVVDRTQPQVPLSQTNDLGIQERIGLGDSEYDHSIPNRIHNVALTSDKINLTIVKPGAEFSFNKVLGDVSTATGFRQAYIIKDGQTVLGDGGGVCQVSTTLFRSVLNAGLPITKRKAHSYRVSYYELDTKPGIDATVYSGEVDLRFVNDTGHHLLIHSQADSKNLEMFIEIYGTSDGRTAEIVDHRTWDARPAPPAIMIPDPTLAPGQKKQIDFAASGIRATFTNVVRDKNGEILRRDTYTSNYVPWAAKYLVGP